MQEVVRWREKIEEITYSMVEIYFRCNESEATHKGSDYTEVHDTLDHTKHRYSD